MSRNSYRRYKPTWRYPEEVTPAEHSALKSEFWVMVFLVAVGLICVFAEPLMDLAEAALR